MADNPSQDEEKVLDVSASSDHQLPPPDILKLDPVYESLIDPRRRYLCYTLLEDKERSLTEIATKIAAWESDIPQHEVTQPQREFVYVSLYHVHVPKLVDEDVITFDAATDTIRAAKHAEQVMAALEGIGASLNMNQDPQARGQVDDDGV